VVADAVGRRDRDLEVADLAQHEQAVVGVVAQGLDPEHHFTVDGARQQEALAAQVIGHGSFDDVVTPGKAHDVFGMNSHGLSLYHSGGLA
jgi:hypothetical protein